MKSATSICIVDDDVSVRNALQRLLRAIGFRVWTCQSAEDFLQMTDAPRFGCLIVDVRMPGLSGLDLLDALNLSACDVPVILMSGHTDARTVARAMAAGAVAVLVKPFDDTVLIEALERALSKGSHTQRDAVKPVLRKD